MSWKDFFKKSKEVSPATDIGEWGKRTKEQIRQDIFDGKVIVQDQISDAQEKFEEAWRKAKDADRTKNLNKKRIASREMKVYLAMYRYAQGMRLAIDILESNYEMNLATQKFGETVDLISKVRIPRETLDFGTLTKKAAKSLKAPDMHGLDNMINALLGNAAGEMDTYEEDQWIEQLIKSDKVKIDDIDAPVFNAAMETETKTETSQTEQQDMDLDDLWTMLDAMKK